MANNNNGPSNSSSSVDSYNTIAAAPTNGVLRSSMITNMLNKTPYDGKLDKYGEVRLRIGIVDNPMIKRSDESRIDPTNPYNVVNMTTGKITIRWLEQDGGLVRSPEFGEYGDDGEGSDREPLSLTHPMMWANETNNWCGINYMPPVGSIVVVGFRKHNLPVLLGFLQSHYQVTYPLELGELMNKGYGYNTSHWKMNDEQEHQAWVNQGDSRPVEILNSPGRKYKMESAPYSVKLKLRLKAWTDPKNPNDKKEMIEMVATKLVDGKMVHESSFEVRPEKVSINSTGDIEFNAKGSLKFKGESINFD